MEQRHLFASNKRMNESNFLLLLTSCKSKKPFDSLFRAYFILGNSISVHKFIWTLYKNLNTPTL